MPSEVAINEPFDSAEIVHIIAKEFQARMRSLSPLQGAKQYAAFSAEFNVKITLRRSGETAGDARETLAWGSVIKGDDRPFPIEEGVVADHTSTFESRDPNEERQARDLPLIVESSDGKGGKVRRKVRVKG